MSAFKINPHRSVRWGRSPQ